ncbi:hypothetical protein HpDR15_07700 [Helicobacter pylori]
MICVRYAPPTAKPISKGLLEWKLSAYKLMTGKTIKSPKNRNEDTNANGKIFLNMRVILQENN